jgi:hypothetical protein
MLRNLRTLSFTFAASALFVLAAIAAPVPRTQPAPWDGSIVGTHRYSWGMSPEGEITFFPDGSYTSHHGGEATFIGRWYFDGTECGIREWRVESDGSLSGGTWYTFSLAPTRAGTLEGVTPGNTPVVLSERR